MSITNQQLEKASDLALVPSFDGAEIRVFAEDAELWISVVDIARAVGYARHSTRELITRNEGSFKPYIHTVHEKCPGKNSPIDNQGLLCVNEQGLYMLLGKMQVSRIKNPLIRETVIRFQQWVPELIRSYRKGDLQPVLAPLPTMALLKHNLEIAHLLCEYTGVSKAIGTAAAVAETERRTKEPLSWCKPMLPAAPEREVGTLNATDIGIRIGLKARKVNALLEDRGYQMRTANGWLLTDAGLQYGEAMPYARNGHTGYQILWRSTVLPKLEERMYLNRQLKLGEGVQ